MKNKILSFILIVFFNTNTAFALNTQLCDQISKLSSILQSYTMIEWPVIGVPGVTYGLSSRSSVLLELCDYVKQLQQLETADAIFLTGQVLNKVTNDRWKHHLDFAEQTWSLAQNAYDFENGEFRKSALESEAFHQEMNSYMNDSYYWYNKTYNGEEKTLKDRSQRESDMRDMANTAYERATLQEALECPEPEGNVNYGKVYDSKIRNKLEPLQESNEEAEFYYSKLLEMGPYFMNNEESHDKYLFQVETLYYQGVTVDTKTRVKQDNSTAFTASKDNAAGSSATAKSKKIDVQFQTFTAKPNAQLFSDFRNEYEYLWKTYVQNRVIQKGFDGLLDDPTAHIEEEFIDLNYECAEYKLMRGVDYNRGDYAQLLLQRKQQCERSVRLNINRIESLLVYYVDKLRVTLIRAKRLQAEIFTVRSREMGQTIVLVDQGAKGDVRSQKVVCEEGNKLSPATMVKLNAKINANNARINEQLSKDTKKLLVVQENERKEKVEVAREMAKRQQFAEKKAKRLSDAQESSPITSPLGQTSKQNY